MNSKKVWSFILSLALMVGAIFPGTGVVAAKAATMDGLYGYYYVDDVVYEGYTYHFDILYGFQVDLAKPEQPMRMVMSDVITVKNVDGKEEYKDGGTSDSMTDDYLGHFQVNAMQDIVQTFNHSNGTPHTNYFKLAADGGIDVSRVNKGSADSGEHSSPDTAAPNNWHGQLVRISNDNDFTMSADDVMALVRKGMQGKASNVPFGGIELPGQTKKPAAVAQPVTSAAVEPVAVANISGDAASTTKVHSGATGVTVSFKKTNALGYRLFRSEDAKERGRSVSEAYITSPNYTDVTVEPNKTYHYTLVEVLAKNGSGEGAEETLGAPLAEWTVTTSPEAGKGFGPSASRHFIILTMGSPMMTVDGVAQEVDPGRGTAPINHNSRTMVPIRAVVEAMGGQAGWNDAKREITLSAKDAHVKMWVDQNTINVNGKEAVMDVAPLIQNGRTFTPIRFAAQNLNCKVDWFDATKEIVIAWSDRD